MKAMRQPICSSVLLLLLLATVAWAAPRITSVSPTSGPPGSCLVINGDGFGATQGTKIPSFYMGRHNDMQVRSWSNTRIEAILPETLETDIFESTSGLVSVYDDSSRRTHSNSVDYRAVWPRITNVSPSVAAEGDMLTVKGRNFGDRPCTKTHVAIGGHGVHVDALLLSWSNIGITVRIPKSDRLRPGNTYYVGISAQGDARWLSNIDKSFRFQERR